MKIKNSFKKYAFSFVLGAVIFGSITAYATYKINSSDVGFTPANESWKVDNVGSAINDLYTNQNETIVDYEKTITSQNTKISTYEKTITQKDSTITNLNTQITSLKNEVANFSSSKCVSGTFVCTSCTTSEGQKIVDFGPSAFLLYTRNSSDTTTLWYYDSRLNTNGWRVYSVSGGGDNSNYNFNTNVFSRVKIDDSLIFYNFGSTLGNLTFYYKACELNFNKGNI